MSFGLKSGIASIRFLDGLMSYLRRSFRKTPILSPKYFRAWRWNQAKYAITSIVALGAESARFFIKFPPRFCEIS